MALIRCNECGKEYSDTAFKCPHCGNIDTPKTQQLKKAGNSIGWMLFIGLVVIPIIVWILLMLAYAK